MGRLSGRVDAFVDRSIEPLPVSDGPVALSTCEYLVRKESSFNKWRHLARSYWPKPINAPQTTTVPMGWHLKGHMPSGSAYPAGSAVPGDPGQKLLPELTNRAGIIQRQGLIQ